MPRGVPNKVEADETLSPEQQQAIKAANADWKAPSDEEKMVRLTIHKPEGDPSKDMFISVNFKAYQIKFGEEVVVPASVAHALKNTNVTTMVQDPHTEKLTPVIKPRFAFSAEAA
jgi:hypothetical protein